MRWFPLTKAKAKELAIAEVNWPLKAMEERR